MTGEITDFSEAETTVRKMMMSRSDKLYFLCDSSKIGQSYLFTVCNSTDVDDIICDAELPDSIQTKPLGHFL